MTGETIDDVIHDLTAIIDECREMDSRLGYFPAMYRKVTAQIKEGVENGRFEDGPRMIQLDVVFAQRYIDAYRQYRQGKQPTRAWAYTFERTEDPQPTVLQHLLLGMNAHINLDLGIAAAEVCRECEIVPLKNDFFAVNQVLAGLLDEVQDGVNQSSPLFQMMDTLGGSADEALGNFSIRRARHAAWETALALHAQPVAARAALIERYDQATSLLAKVICPPFYVVQRVTAVINQPDPPSPREIIDALA
ncbi:MAG: DUF5995 family protein [Candidatus Promineifilaceae bacterium]